MSLSSHQPNGGPAFPVVTEQYDHGWEKEMPKAVAPGMTLRDYFAAHAPHPYPEEWKQQYCARGYQGEAKCMADWSYDYADAMLKARGA
jgi:hypothetical protein